MCHALCMYYHIEKSHMIFTKFNKIDIMSLFLKGRNRDCERSHGLLRPLAKFMVEVRLEPDEAPGLSTVLGHLLHTEKVKPKAKGKSVWNEIR